MSLVQHLSNYKTLINEHYYLDHRYKWSKELQKIVLEPLGITPPASLLTPPYLTALPEVFYHRLTPNDKFLVLATDGLWEWYFAFFQIIKINKKIGLIPIQ